MKYLKHIISLVLLFVGICAFTQTVPTLTDAEINKVIDVRVRQKVDQLGDYISFMASKDKSEALRKDYMNAALSLFIGDGGPYEIMGKHRNGVIMQTTSLYRRKPRKPLMRDYFLGLINLKYAKVEIDTIEINSIKVSQLRRIDEDTYMCTASYWQKFHGYGKDGQPLYSDATKKEVSVIVKVDHTIDGDEYVVLFGDVYATETKRL